MEIKCKHCRSEFDITTDEHTPSNAVSMWCSNCPNCEHKMCDDYKEGYLDKNGKKI